MSVQNNPDNPALPAEAQARVLKLRYQSLMDATLDGIHIMDADGNLIEANAAFCNLLGYTREEAHHLHVTDWNAQFTREELKERFKRFETVREGIVFETLHRRKDGTFVNVEVHTTGVEIDGKLYLFAASRDITRRKQTEQANRVLLSRYSALMGNIPEGIHLMDDTGHMVEVNDAFCNMLGYSREEALKLHVSDWDARFSREELMARMEDFLRAENLLFETVHRRKDGVLIDVEVSTTGVEIDGRRYLLALSRDITERKRSQRQMELMKFSADHLADGVNWSRPDARIVYANDAFCHALGYTREEILGMRITDFDPDYPVEMWPVHWEELKQTGSMTFESRHRAKDGRIFPVEINANYIRYGDEEYNCAYVRNITERKRSEELIWRQANYDALTGLANRQMFHDRLEHDARKSQRSGKPLAVLLIDLDRFKEVNDTLGHDRGDLLLVEASRRISSCVRESDTVARLGGDEFIIILSELDDVNSVERVAQGIIDKLAAPFNLGADEAYISATIGISLYPNDTGMLDDLLKNADQAMYAAKNAGRSRFSYFTPDMQAAAQKRLRLANDLRTALALNQFRVYYQPVVDLSNGSIHKAEALLRWQHPARGMVSPMDFIPVAEETGMIFAIGDWVFRQVVGQARTWRAKYHRTFQISVNASPLQLHHSVEGSVNWVDYIKSQNLPGQGVTVEITEGLLLHTEPGVNERLLAFRDAGIHVAIDDFGTGYSSLSYLNKFDIDYIKIDRTFVSNLERDDNSHALCEAIIVMAHKLGLKVIAEGVETGAQRDILQMAGCNYAQGFFYSRPLPPAEFEKFLDNRLARAR